MQDRALNTFIRRTYHRPPRRRCMPHGLALALSVIVCYISVLTILSHLDNTPNWAYIKTPRVATFDRPFTVSVRFKDFADTAQLSVSASLTDDHRRYLGRLLPQKPECQIQGTGQKAFQFSIPADPNVAFIQLQAEYQALPAGRSVPAQHGNKLGEPVSSDRIPVHENSLEFRLNHTRAVPWRAIFSKALDDGHWKEHAGDYTPIGWFVTGLYLLGAVICMICAGKSYRHSSSCAWFWWLCTLAMFLLGINKQLDLQILLADLGRTYAQSYAWYSRRRPVQIQAVSVGLALCLGLVEIVLCKLSHRSKITWLALFGLMSLALYFGLRLVSLHQIDRYLTISCRGLTVGNLFEIGGILCVCLSALAYYYVHRHAQAQYILR